MKNKFRITVLASAIIVSAAIFLIQCSKKNTDK